MYKFLALKEAAMLQTEDHIKNLTGEDKAQIRSFIKDAIKLSKRRYVKRGKAILLANQGKTIKQISTELDVCAQSVWNWLTKYRESGLDGLNDLEHPPHPPGRLNPEQIDKIVTMRYPGYPKRVKKYDRAWSFRKMSRWIKEEWGVTLSYERIRQILNKKLLLLKLQ